MNMICEYWPKGRPSRRGPKAIEIFGETTEEDARTIVAAMTDNRGTLLRLKAKPARTLH